MYAGVRAVDGSDVAKNCMLGNFSLRAVTNALHRYAAYLVTH